jgi:hypothetical protein
MTGRSDGHNKGKGRALARASGLIHAVFFLKTLDPTAGLHQQFLAARVKRMALGTDLYAYVFPGGAGNKLVAAVASYFSLKVFGMDSRFHLNHHPLR